LFHRISIADKLELYFNDYQLSPLFVQENYIKSSSCSLNQMAFNADILSQSEILSSFSQRKQEYSLLPAIGVLSVIPTSVSLNQRIQFPSLLGQISKINKASRLVKEISLHMSLSTTSQKEELRLEYYPVLIRRLNQLISGQKLEQAVEFMNDYNLLRTDYDSMTDMGFTPNTLTTQMKSQFTRLFNKSSGRVKYNLGYKGVEGLEEAGEQGEEETSEAVEEEDKMIVTKKAKTAAPGKKTKASAAKKTTTKKPTSKSKSKK
jgi:replication factor C subunit 1